MRILETRRTDGLGTLYLASLGPGDGRVVEFVDTLEPGVPRAEKWVMMISTQFGCPVGCRMCDAGAGGYRGNLTAEQMLAQVRRIAEDNPGLPIGRHPKVKIHFARMGEPALNPAVPEALERLADEHPGGGVLPSLSTIAPKGARAEAFFERLLDVKTRRYPGGRFQLQFSVHALDEDARDRVAPMPKWGLERIAEYGRRFVAPGDRKITLNFALAPGESLDASRLASLFSPESFLVKITPINPTATAARRGVVNAWVDAPREIAASEAGLRARGFRVIVSPSLPEEIAAETSCGQLWSGALKRRAAGAAARGRAPEAYVDEGSLDKKTRAWLERLRPWSRRPQAPSLERSALVVVDMQRLFVDPESRSYLPAARAVLGRVITLVEAFRSAGRPVYFLRHAHRDPRVDGGLMTRWWRGVCLDGSEESRLCRELRADGSPVFRKTRYSGFSNPAFHRRLRRDGIACLAVCGVATNLCVESTIRDAFDRGLETLALVDATAARAEELHLAALQNLAHGFSTPLSTAQLADLLASNG